MASMQRSLYMYNAAGLETIAVVYSSKKAKEALTPNIIEIPGASMFTLHNKYGLLVLVSGYLNWQLLIWLYGRSTGVSNLPRAHAWVQK